MAKEYNTEWVCVRNRWDRRYLGWYVGVTRVPGLAPKDDRDAGPWVWHAAGGDDVVSLTARGRGRFGSAEEARADAEGAIGMISF